MAAVKHFDLSSIRPDMCATIWVPDRSDAKTLLDALMSCGYVWEEGEPLTETYWDEYCEKTCYFVSDGVLSLGDRGDAEYEGAPIYCFILMDGDKEGDTAESE